MGVWRTLGLTVIRPARAFQSLSTGPRPLSKGAKAMALVGVLYALTATGLAAGGALVMIPTFLNVLPENYYFWEIFFALPVFFAAWLAAAGAAYLAGGGLSRGGFKGLASALAFAFAAPALLLWIPSTALAVLLLLGEKQERIMDLTAQPGTVQYVGIGFQVFALLWILALSAAAARSARPSGPKRSAWPGLLAAAVFLVFVLAFVR
jgi:hypothetical protein